MQSFQGILLSLSITITSQEHRQDRYCYSHSKNEKSFKGVQCLICCVVLSHSVMSDSLKPLDYRPPGSSVHGDSPGKNTGVGCHALLQGIFLTQGLNPGLLHCRQIFYCLSHQGSPRIMEWVSLSLLQGIIPTQESNQGLLHCRQILYHLRYQGSP